MQKETDLKLAASESKWIGELDHLLLVGMKHGRRGVQEAIEGVLRLATGLTRGDCQTRIRYLRRGLGFLESGQTGHQSGTEDARWRGVVRKSNPRRPWTEQDDRDLRELAGYESVKRLSERLNRSEFAIRSRLSALGVRGSVRDAWSLRRLSATFHVHRYTLLGWIAKGQLRVTDSRVTRMSLLCLFEDYRTLFSPAVEKRLFNSGAEAYTWKQVEQIFDVPGEEVRGWIASAKVKIVNPSVTERAFERFCKGPPAGLNLRRIDAEELDWLIEEYGLKPTPPSDIKTEQAEHEEGNPERAS